MLELSVYEDIPHLLAEVVTEPGKAIGALKWTVEQMEERYRMMANLGVRALAGFNAKVREAKAKGRELGATGADAAYDADTASRSTRKSWNTKSCRRSSSSSTNSPI